MFRTQSVIGNKTSVSKPRLCQTVSLMHFNECTHSHVAGRPPVSEIIMVYMYFMRTCTCDYSS